VSAELIEPLILAGRIPPFVSVGVPFGEDRGADRRAQEYPVGLPRHRQAPLPGTEVADEAHLLPGLDAEVEASEQRASPRRTTVWR